MTSLLVIEPIDAHRSQITKNLETAGFKVWPVASIEQARSARHPVAPDVIILDPQQLALTSLDLQLLKQQLFPDSALVLYSIDISRSALLFALRSGACDLVAKGDGQIDQLIAALHRTIEWQRTSEKKPVLTADTLLSLEEDLRAARHVQRSLLPVKPYFQHGVRANYELYASRYLSGDLVDYFELQPGWFLFYILDVSGHGVASALITILLRNEINRLRRDWHLGMDETIEHPHLILQHLNSVLHESELGKHATLWIGLLDVRLKTLRYANAGHYPYPLVSMDGEVQWLQNPCVPIGLFAQAQFNSVELHYESQLSLALCSDGVFEAMAETQLEQREARLLEVVTLEQFDLARIAEAFNVTPHAEVIDDMTILVILQDGVS